jgi:DNA-binding transcriptional LysR family regulator
MSRLPDLEALAIFAKVAETRAVTAAAAELGLSAPTVSKALARLEHRIGARLFNRTSRRLVLTEAGQALAPRAARVVADAEAAEAEMLMQAETPRGRVRLGAPMSYGISQVAQVLPDFLALYPLVSVDLHLSDARMDLIGEGFDALLRIGVLADSSLLARRLASVPMMLVAAPAYLDQRGRPAHPSELGTHACFGYAYTQDRGGWRFRGADGTEVSVVTSGRMTGNNGEALLPALIAGLGIARMPHFIAAAALSDGRLEPVLPAWALPEVSLHLLTAAGSPQPARVRVLVDFLVQRLSRR